MVTTSFWEFNIMNRYVSLLVCVVSMAVFCGAAAQADPITFTSESYNFDGVWTGGADTFVKTVGNWGWYKNDPSLFGGACGLPATGLIAGLDGVTFQLAPYGENANNVLRVGGATAMTLATPSQFATLSVLSSQSGTAPIPYTLHFSDLSETTGTVATGEWSAYDTPPGPATNLVYGADATNGSVLLSALIGKGSTPTHCGLLFQGDITLSPADQAKTLVSVAFANAANSPATVIWAVSGAAVPEPSTIVLLGLAAFGLIFLRRKAK
jgi:hypothetical protein